MKTTHLLRGTAAFVLAASAAAQAPNFYQLPSTATPMDVTTAGGTTLVAGADGSNAFLWTPAGGTVTIVESFTLPTACQ